MQDSNIDFFNEVKVYIPKRNNYITDVNVKELSINKIIGLNDEFINIHNLLNDIDYNKSNIQPLFESNKLLLDDKYNLINNNYLLFNSNHINNNYSLNNKIEKYLIKNGDLFNRDIFLSYGIDSFYNDKLIIGPNSKIINIANNDNININIGTSLKSKIINIGNDNTIINMNSNITHFIKNNLEIYNKKFIFNNNINFFSILFDNGYININNYFQFKFPNDNTIFNLSSNIQNSNDIISLFLINNDINHINNIYSLFKINSFNHFSNTADNYFNFINNIDQIYQHNKLLFDNKYNNYFNNNNNNKLNLINNNTSKYDFYTNILNNNLLYYNNNSFNIINNLNNFNQNINL